METNNFTPTPTPADNGKTAAIISYFTIVGWLIAYFAMYKDNKTAFSSYQMRQTLLINIIAIVVSWGLGFIIGALMLSTGMFSLIYITYIFQIGIFIIWLVGLLGAINGEQKPMPLIGEKAQTMFPTI